jgi:thiamine biosynthesis protein ThiS
MEVKVNGKVLTLADGTTGAGLLHEVDFNAATLVAEVNGEIVRKADFLGLELHEGDSLELVTLVGGG